MRQILSCLLKRHWGRDGGGEGGDGGCRLQRFIRREGSIPRSNPCSTTFIEKRYPFHKEYNLLNIIERMRQILSYLLKGPPRDTGERERERGGGGGAVGYEVLYGEAPYPGPIPVVQLLLKKDTPFTYPLKNTTSFSKPFE